MPSSTSQIPEMTSSATEREKVFSLIKDIQTCQLVTQNLDGQLFARPMMAQERDANDDLWFFTAADSPKIIEIKANPDVLLSYSDPQSNSYVSMTGRAQVTRDQSRINQLWSEGNRTWFPDGPMDENLCLVRVSPESAEYWDAPSSKFVIAFGYQARITGQQPRFGDNRVVFVSNQR